MAVDRAAGQDDGDGDGSPGGTFGSGFVGIVDASALASAALIEEAVASGGDSTLWTDGEDEACDRENRIDCDVPEGNEP